MKSNIIAILVVLVLTLSLRAADTNAPAPDVGSQLKTLASTVYSQVANLDLKRGVIVEPIALYHKGDFGGGLALSTANTNGLNLGLAVVAVNEKNDKGKRELNFYDASLSIAYKTPVKVPVINMTLDASLATGLACNARDPKTLYSQSTATLSKSWDLGNSWHLKAGGGIGHLSRWSDPFYVGFVGVTKLF